MKLCVCVCVRRLLLLFYLYKDMMKPLVTTFFALCYYLMEKIII